MDYILSLVFYAILAKAAALKAFAYQMRVTNLEAFIGNLKEAGRMFESLGKIKYAASCGIAHRPAISSD
ncbi:hypothetical protein Tco_1077809 [Tanacetum coccineum]